MFLQALQFQQQQAAQQQALNYSTQFGNAPGGNWMTWGAGGPTQPLPGTETQSALQQGIAAGQTAAGLTGYYANPQSWTYQPGTYVRNAQTGTIGQIQAGGQLTTTANVPAGLNVNLIPNVDAGTFTQLQAGGQGAQGTGLTQQAAAQQQNLALQQAGVTGLYNQPLGNIAADAWAKAGPQAQQAYLQNTQGDVQTAMNRYWADMQGAISQAGMTPQQYVYGTNGPTPTMALQQMYGTYGTPTPGQQTLQAINQAAQLSGMYQGAPTEAAREFNQQQMQQLAEFQQNLGLQQGQLGQQYLATAAQLQGPQNTFQLSNYLRGAQANPNVPTYLQNLQNNTAGQMAAFQGTGSTTPTPQSAQGLMGQMGYGGTDANGNPITSSATPGWDYNSTLNTINQIAQQGAQSLAPGSLEKLTPDELQAFGSGLGAAGYTLPSFMSAYNASRVGQQAPVGAMSLS